MSLELFRAACKVPEQGLRLTYTVPSAADADLSIALRTCSGQWLHLAGGSTIKKQL